MRSGQPDVVGEICTVLTGEQREPKTYTGDPRSKDIGSDSMYKGTITKGNRNGGEGLI